MELTNKEWNRLEQWTKDEKHLPEFLRDFHKQKDLFKAMHILYESNNENDPRKEMPNWRNGHVYTIDWFLWYMGQRGYTLQKNKTKIKFKQFENWREIK